MIDAFGDYVSQIEFDKDIDKIETDMDNSEKNKYNEVETIDVNKNSIKKLSNNESLKINKQNESNIFHLTDKNGNADYDELKRVLKTFK